MMVQMKDFSIEQLGIFVVSVLGALGVCIKAIQKSRCDRVDCFCLKIHRNVPNDVAEPEMSNELVVVNDRV